MMYNKSNDPGRNDTMNEVWNLDPIYKGFSDPAFEADICSAKELLAEYTAFTGALVRGKSAYDAAAIAADYTVDKQASEPFG